MADIARPLQSLRSLDETGHKVVCGDGEKGDQHYIENTTTGEANLVNDDGLNHLMTCHIAPPSAMGFAGPTLSA